MVIDVTYAATEILYGGLLTAILTQRPRSRLAVPFALMVGGLALWTGTLYAYFFTPLSEWLIVVGRLNYAAIAIAAAGLLLLVLLFEDATRWKRIRYLILAETALLSGIAALTPYVDAAETMSAAGPIITFGPLYAWYVMRMAIYLGAAALMGLRNIVRLQGLLARKFRLVFGVFVLCGSALFVTNAVLPAWHIFVLQAYSFLIMAPAAVVCFYAMYWHRLFNLSYVALASMRLILLGMASVIPTAGITLLAHGIAPHASLVPSIILGGTIGIVLYHFADRNIPAFLGSSVIEMRRHCANLQVAVHSCATFAALQTLVERTFIVHLNISPARIYAATGKRLARQIGRALYTRLASHQEIVLRDECALHPADHAVMRAMDISAMRCCIPLFFDGALIGILALGSKEHDAPYAQEDIDILLALRPSLEVALTNVLMKEHLLEEKNILKDVIRQKTDTLRHKNKVMRELTRQQADFIALAAHELRTPLTVAHIQADALQKTIPSESAAHARATAIQAALSKLNHLIKALFDMQLFDLEKARLTLEPIDLTRYLHTLCEEYEPICAERNIRLIYQGTRGPIAVRADSQFLCQVFQNLLSNAREFAPIGSSIELRVETQHARAVCRIIDHGPGIPDENKTCIFEKFHRSTEQSKGIGLGLYLAHHIIRHHDGEIWVEDTPGGGATFCCTLPIALESDVTTHSSQKNPAATRNDGGQGRIRTFEG